MNILFLSYWEADEGLSKATVIPHLLILSRIQNIRKIVYCSIERSKKQVEEATLGANIIHVPLYSGKSYFHKVLDFGLLPKTLGRLVRMHAVDVVVCRGSPAGSLGYLVNKNMGTPYVVESFEPHARYMVDSGVWSKHGLKYRFQSKWENAQLRTAYRVITVSKNYRDYLVAIGVTEEKILTVRCAVDAEKFSYDAASRAQMRKTMGFPESAIVGVYTGKFGGLYYDREAFQIFSSAFQCIRNFRLIILTPEDRQTVQQKLDHAGIDQSSCYVRHVTHETVASYLSAADLAFALYKPSPSRSFLSPIKVGEYWANGLPVLLTAGVGDDSRIIQTEGGGVTFSFYETGSVPQGLKFLEKLILENGRERLSETISKLALKYRNFRQVHNVYDQIFSGR